MRWAQRVAAWLSMRTNGPVRSAKSCGLGAAVLALNRGALTRSAMTGATEPFPGESTYKPFKPSRREGRDVLSRTCGSAACIFSAGGPWGRQAPGLPRALFDSLRANIRKTRAVHAARTRHHIRAYEYICCMRM